MNAPLNIDATQPIAVVSPPAHARREIASKLPMVDLSPEIGTDFGLRHAGFAFDLLRASWRQEKKGNLCIAPYSAAVALALVYNGAAGITAEQMATLLHISDISMEAFNALLQRVQHEIKSYDAGTPLEAEAKESTFDYVSPNSVWIDHSCPVHQSYQACCQELFGALVKSVSFEDPETVKLINGWVAEQTNNKIPNLLPSTNGMDALALINAFYFQDEWQYQFQKDCTEEAKFTCGDGTITTVPMMSWAKPSIVPYLQTELFESVVLPYENAPLAMVLMKPAEHIDLPTLVESISKTDWAYWLSQYQFAEGKVSLPRFTLESDITLNGPLQSLGMIDAFGPADFSGISEQLLHISWVLQKSYLKVDEKGSEAAAATAVILTRSLGPQPDFDFVANKPFLSILYDHQTGAIPMVAMVDSPA